MLNVGGIQPALALITLMVSSTQVASSGINMSCALYLDPSRLHAMGAVCDFAAIFFLASL